MDTVDATKLANAIKDTWKLGPTQKVWWEFLRDEVEKPTHAIAAVGNLRKAHTASDLTLGTFWNEYIRLIAADMHAHYNEHGECVACTGLGFISYTETSPVSGLPTEYSVECEVPIPAANQAEWDYYFKPIHPREGREIAWVSYINGPTPPTGAHMTRDEFMRRLSA